MSDERRPLTTKDFLDRLEKVRERPNGQWLACCPAHDDKNPSLSIREGDNIPILYCFSGGCDYRQILNSVGLSPGDFFPVEPTTKYDGNRTKRPRLNGWDAIAVLKHRIMTCCIGVGDIANGKDLSDSDLDALVVTLTDIYRILGECHDIR